MTMKYKSKTTYIANFWRIVMGVGVGGTICGEKRLSYDILPTHVIRIMIKKKYDNI